MLTRSSLSKRFALALAACALPFGGAAAVTTPAPTLSFTGTTVAVIGSTSSSDTAVFMGHIAGEAFPVMCGVKLTIFKQGSSVPVFTRTSPTRSFMWETAAPGLYSLRISPVAVKPTGECLTTTTSQTVGVMLKALPADALTVTTRMTAAQAPASVVLVAKPKDATVAAMLTGATYHWHVSGGALDFPKTSILQETKSSALSFRSSVGSEQPNMYSLRVSMGEFSMDVANGTVTVPPAPPFSLAAGIRPAQRWSHAPMKMMVAPTVASMVPGEIITERIFTVNGLTVPVLPGRPFMVDAQTAGEYTVAGTVRTNKNRSATMSYSVQVPDPDTPTCSLTASVYSAERGIYKFVASGASTTGYIAKYIWRQGDRVIPISTNTLLLRLDTTGSNAAVSVDAVSDAGRTCHATPSFV